MTTQTFDIAISQDLPIAIALSATPSSDPSTWEVAFFLRRKGVLVMVKLSPDDIECTDTETGAWEFTISSDETEADLSAEVDWDEGDPVGMNSRSGEYTWAFWRVDAGNEEPLAVGTMIAYKTARSG